MEIERVTCAIGGFGTSIQQANGGIGVCDQTANDVDPISAVSVPGGRRGIGTTSTRIATPNVKLHGYRNIDERLHGDDGGSLVGPRR